jgi:hypothetical protein
VWVKKFRSVLLATLVRQPATHELRVTCHSPIDGQRLSAGHSDFLRRLRRATGCEYWQISEWAQGKRHVHVLVRAEEKVSPRLIRELWHKALPGMRLGHHAGRVRDQVAIAMYLTKFVESPPASFSGRLFSSSREFFHKPLTQLMKEKTRPIVLSSEMVQPKAGTR